ncbi:hypothetical protein RSAG8_06657, partial [Rhizoctonia solani AG-8 WAC10335]
MAASTAEDQGEGQDLLKRQRCSNGVPISTRYEASTITTYYVSYSYYTPPSRSTNPLPETLRPASTTVPRPQISIEPEKSTTWLPPRKSLVPTTSDIIPKPRAIQGVPVTIARTIVTRVPVETIYSCPPSREPPTIAKPPTSRDDSPPTSREPPTSSRDPSTSREPTSSVEPTSRSARPTSWWTNTTEPPSTRRWPTASSGEPWGPSSSTPSTPTSRHRPTEVPSTSPPPSTQPTSSIPPRTSIAPNSTTAHPPWPPTTTPQSYSECVYTLFDGTVPYGNYTASCTGSATSGSWCTSFHSNGEWNLVPCTILYCTTSTLTNTTTSTRTITSWPCSSYVPSWETWIGVPCTSSTNVTSSTWPCSSYATSLDRWVSAPCTSTMPNITTSSIERCRSFLGSPSPWAVVPCTSTPPTITTTPTVTTTPTFTHSRSCSTYVEDLKTWLPMPCDPITTTPTIITIPSITITRNITETPNVTVASTITETPITEAPTITGRPSASHSRHCSIYVTELELWVSVPCTTANPTPSMCLNVDQDMWVPCTSVTRTSDTDTLSQTITGASVTSPIFITVTLTPHTPTSQTPPPQTLFPTITRIESVESTLTVKPTRTEETETHTPTLTRPPHPSSATSIRTSHGFTLGSSLVVKPSSTRQVESTSTREPPSTRETPSTREVGTTGASTHFELTQPTSSQRILTSNFVIPTGSITIPSPSSTITTTPGGIQRGALVGIIVGSILGVVGLLGLGAFFMKSLSGHRSHDLFGPRGGYQAASGSGSVGGRDNGGSGGGGGGSGGMSEARNASPLRSALRNRNMVDGGGGWSDASWNQAYTGVAVAAAAAATTANNQRGRDSEASGRYGEGGTPSLDEDARDAVPQRYGDGGLTGPDSHYDTGISDHPYGNQDLRYLVSSSEVQFDPYHDLPVHQDSFPVGGNITRQSAYTTPEV